MSEIKVNDEEDNANESDVVSIHYQISVLRWGGRERL